MDQDDWRGPAPKPGAPHGAPAHPDDTRAPERAVGPDASARPDTLGVRGFPPERQARYPVAGGAVAAADRAADEEASARAAHEPVGPAGNVEARDVTGGPARFVSDRTADPARAAPDPGDLLVERPGEVSARPVLPPRADEEERGEEPVERPRPDPLASRWVLPFEKTLRHTRDWMRDVALALGTKDPRDARHALHAVLGTLRDQLPVAEIADLAASLPLPVRGLLFEGWTGRTAKRDTRDAFVDEVKRRLGPRARLDPEVATDAVFEVLRRRVPAGELNDVRAVLPKELKRLVAPAHPAGE